MNVDQEEAEACYGTPSPSFSWKEGRKPWTSVSILARSDEFSGPDTSVHIW